MLNMKRRQLNILSLGLVLLIYTSGSNCSVCDEPEREDDLEACLDFIRDVMEDNERFWFGTSYIEKCEGIPQYDITCYNPHDPVRNHSMYTLLFPDGGYDPALLDRFINVTFNSLPGSYTGCEYYYEQNETISYTLDPADLETNQRPWDVRDPPDVTWDFEDDTQYTLVVQDGGFLFLHAVYTNIPGNDIGSSDVISPYIGSLNFREDTNPYAFMLLKQRVKDIEVLPEWIDIINTRLRFSIAEFRDDHNMTGPHAMNFIYAGFDLYSVGIQTVLGAYENCGAFVEKAQEEYQQHPFIPEDTVSSVVIRVTIANEELAFTYCCTDHFYPNRTIDLNPIGNGFVDAAEARSENTVTYNLNQNRVLPRPSRDFGDKLFTVLSVDPDVPSPEVGTPEYPLVHALAMNGEVDRSGFASFERELFPWNGPSPPDDLPHSYMFLLYEQLSGFSDLEDTEKYTVAPCGEGLEGKCLFNISYFTEDNDLDLVGTSWLVSENNDFVNYDRGVEEDEEVCGERWPCDEQPYSLYHV